MDPAKILIADDIEANRNTLRDWVAVLGHVAIIADDGQAALDLALQSPPDLMLLDIMMPKLDGYGVIQRMKASRTLRQVPIVVISALDETDSVVRCLELGADDYLTKPFNPRLLRARVSGCLEKYRLVKSERELLEGTLAGSVHALAHLLLLSNPDAFRRAQALRDLVRQWAADMGLRDTWVLEVASMLRDIGSMALPTEVSAAIRERRALTAAEATLVNQVPEVGYRLLAGIPRMESVAEVVRYQSKHFDGSGPPAGGASGDAIPLGARILFLLDDFQELLVDGTAEIEACATLRTRAGFYDPALLDLLTARCGTMIADLGAGARLGPNAWDLDAAAQSANVPAGGAQTAHLSVGQFLANDVYTRGGTLLVNRGTRLTEALLARIRNHEVLTGLRGTVQVFRKSSISLTR